MAEYEVVVGGAGPDHVGDEDAIATPVDGVARVTQAVLVYVALIGVGDGGAVVGVVDHAVSVEIERGVGRDLAARDRSEARSGGARSRGRAAVDGRGLGLGLSLLLGVDQRGRRSHRRVIDLLGHGDLNRPIRCEGELQNELDTARGVALSLALVHLLREDDGDGRSGAVAVRVLGQR